MYHIKNDERSIASAVKIYRSVRHILLRKPLPEVTISDIKEECGISRSTFYRSFDSILDVLEYRLDEFYKEYKTLSLKDPNKLHAFFDYWNRHSDLIYILSKQNNDIIKKVIVSNSSIDTEDSGKEYLLDIKYSIMTSILTKWVERGKIETPEEMEEIARKILSESSISILLDF